MSTIALNFWKTYIWYSKKSEIKYTYTYEHFKGAVEILEKIFCILSYTKRQISNKNLFMYTNTNLLIFCGSKYDAISTETSHDY
jgi:hypothetical protein